MSKTKENPLQKPFLAIVLCAILILRVTLIFKWWGSVVIFFQGVTGMFISGCALLGLYTLTRKCD